MIKYITLTEKIFFHQYVEHFKIVNKTHEWQDRLRDEIKATNIKDLEQLERCLH